MGETIRFGMSIDGRLLENFDRLIEQKGYSNRSEAIRDLVRSTVTSEQWEHGDEVMVGTVTFIYDHHVRNIPDKLIKHQRDYHYQIISSLHIHIDAHNCMEVLVVRGKANEVKTFADELIGIKGVKHGKLVMTTTGEAFPAIHRQG